MASKRNRKRDKDQRDSEHRDRLQEKMAEVGFVPGTQAAYLRAFDRFEAKLDRKTGETATVRDARRYLSRLKESDVSNTVYSHASAALRFFFEQVRGLRWKTVEIPDACPAEPALALATTVHKRVFVESHHCSLSGA